MLGAKWYEPRLDPNGVTILSNKQTTVDHMVNSDSR